jgi:cobalt-zinc-cadmium efflux system outer membrane protein
MSKLIATVIAFSLAVIGPLAAFGADDPPGNIQAAARTLTLRECIERALARHPALLAARARIQGARELRRTAGARPNPTLSVQTENWRWAGAPSFDPARELDIFVFGTQTLETGNKAARRREAAEQTLAVTQAEADTARWRIAQEVTRHYFRALYAQTALGILAENRMNLDQLVLYNTVRVREGYAAEGELIRARLEQQHLTSAEAAAAQEAERARLDLLKTMSETEWPPDFRVTDPALVTPLALSLEQLHSEALAKRPELRARRARLEQARAHLRLAQAQARPDWAVSFGYKRTTGYNTLIAGVSVPLPVFNKNLGPIGQAAAEVTAAEQELAAEEHYIRAEVTAFYRAAAQLEQRAAALQKDFLIQADESRNVALAAYREGAADLHKLLEAQRARNEARLLYYRTVYDYQFNLMELHLAMGREIVGGQ